jgi:hypothetical protein
LITAAGRPTGPIVWDLLESVKQYEAWGQDIEFERPKTCRYCGRDGTLVVHEKRWRKRAGVLACRFRCGRRGRPEEVACGKTITLLPSFVYPFRHYGFEQIQPVLFGRCVESPQISWRELGIICKPAWESTLRGWLKAFRGCAQLWSEGLLKSFAHIRSEFALPRSLGETAEKAVLDLATLFLDWRERNATGKGLESSMVLQRLWGWGSHHLKIPLLLSPTFAMGRRWRTPNKGPP